MSQCVQQVRCCLSQNQARCQQPQQQQHLPPLPLSPPEISHLDSHAQAERNLGEWKGEMTFVSKQTNATRSSESPHQSGVNGVCNPRRSEGAVCPNTESAVSLRQFCSSQNEAQTAESAAACRQRRSTRRAVAADRFLGRISSN